MATSWTRLVRELSGQDISKEGTWLWVQIEDLWEAAALRLCQEANDRGQSACKEAEFGSIVEGLTSSPSPKWM